MRLLCSSCHAGMSLSHGKHGEARTDAEIDALFNRLTAVDTATPARACDADEWESTLGRVMHYGNAASRPPIRLWQP